MAENNSKNAVELLPPKDADESTFMRWYRNLGPGQSFSGGDNWSADHSLQLMTGYTNYCLWKNSANGLIHKAKVIIPFSTAGREQKVLEANSRPLRSEDVD